MSLRPVVVCTLVMSAVTITAPASAQVPDDPAFAAQPAVAPGPVAASRSVDGTPVPSTPVPRPMSDRSPVDVSDPTIRKAIADSKQLMDGVSAMPRSSFGNGGASVRERIDQAFRDAEIPTCLTMDAFKFNPPAIGPFTFTGFAALPFWAHAIASGGCRF